ncbi:MAG: hypothetical protein EXR92_04800 [Gemmatimonadetes bacterium]|nr:hypothetical protein [Gemmatimonadota bacterium]
MPILSSPPGSSPSGYGPERLRLRAVLADRFRRGVREGWSEEVFNGLALEVFRYQVEASPVYGRFVQNRGIDPGDLEDWREIPSVPVRAFQEIPEGLVPAGPVEAVFRTSGTTRSTRRGEHRVRDLSLYRASLLATASSYLRPELEDGTGAAARGGGAPLRVLALLPPPAALPDSSLCHMAGVLHEEWDDGAGGFFADVGWSLDLVSWESALRDASRDTVPVLVLATAFSLLGWLDRRPPGDLPRLPEGSRLMETGGYKGRSRSVPKDELYSAIESVVGIPAGRIVSEYGMTELLSQFYEPVLRDLAHRKAARRHFVGPPWVRTRVLDPVTLAAAPAGTPGLLSHVDLANLDSIAAILTEDEGIEVDGGFRVLGRIQGAEPRGCSLAIEDLLEAEGSS